MQIQNVTTVQELQELLVDDKFAFVVECGFLKPATSVVMGDIADLVHTVFLEYVILRSTQEIAQFRDGLEALGIATLIQQHPLPLKKLFLHDHTENVTAQYLSDLLKPVFSPHGHNQREDEEAVILNWHDYLKDVEGVLIGNCSCVPCICMHTMHIVS